MARRRPPQHAPETHGQETRDTPLKLKPRDLNVALRARQALELRKQGYTYDDIAAACGYDNRSGAFKAIQRELQRTITPAAERVRELELGRLDDLLKVYYAKALAGDGWSLDRSLHIMERRSAYLGLDAPTPKAEASVAALPVIREYPEGVAEAV